MSGLSSATIDFIILLAEKRTDYINVDYAVKYEVYFKGLLGEAP